MNRRVSYTRWYREIFHSIKRSQLISQQTSCIFNISKNYLLGLEKGENNSALVWVELSWGWAWQYALYSTINRFVIIIRTKVHLYSPYTMGVILDPIPYSLSFPVMLYFFCGWVCVCGGIHNPRKKNT